MSAALRLSEKWFQRGLWLVALVFAGFLIGLGGTVVGDLPKVERALTVEDFIDQSAAQPLRAQERQAQQAAEDARNALDQARLQRSRARSEMQAEQESFNNWLATRRATQNAEHDPAVVERTQRIDALRQAEVEARRKLQAQEQAALDAQQSAEAAAQRLQAMEGEALDRLRVEQRRVELRVFLYRLALTLPLLVAAGWLFAKKRRSQWWPFVWGFIWFALFAFFVELVPYLPSYGGYVRYIVGIVLTVLVGRYAIVALGRYLERQRQAEARPDAQRRQALDYDQAQARLAKGVCPGCERPVDLKNGAIDFCPHCGIGLFERCGHCGARKSAFARFCHACGMGKQVPVGAAPAPAHTPAKPPDLLPKT